MDLDQILATGGASGLSGVIIYFLYKFLTSKHKIVSDCCGKKFSISTEDTSTNNVIIPVDDQDTNLPSAASRNSEERSDRNGCENPLRVSKEASASEKEPSHAL